MATHALIPGPWRDALNAVVCATGTPQRDLIAEAVSALLVRAEAGFIPDTPTLPRGGLVALVARIPEHQQKALHALADRTRIRYSEWLRQAVVDVLREHKAMPDPGAAARPCVGAAPANGKCGCGLRLLPGEAAPCQDCREVAP